MNRVPRRHPDIVWRDEPQQKDEIMRKLEAGEPVDDAGWVIVVDGGTIHQLNLLAGEIWLRCDGAMDERAIADELAQSYDAPVGEILEDVNAFVTECFELGWLTQPRQ
jgi:GeoRSP system PqqD family protein